MELSDISFSVSLDKGRSCEWGSRTGLSSLFAQKKNVQNPYFWQMIREILKFKDDVISYLDMLENNPDIDRNEILGEFIKSRGYSELFQKAYLVEEELEREGSHIITNREVHLVSTTEKGCVVYCKDGTEEVYDGCILAVHAPDALRLLGDEATYDE